jgi:hypothetical protein
MSDEDTKLIEFYKTQWELIHDLNDLDWRVSLIFVPLMASISFIFGIALEQDINQISEFVTAVRLTAFVTFLFCIYGLWTVAKGHSHAILKFRTLTEIEKELKVDKFIIHRRKFRENGLWLTALSRRSVLFVIYCIFALMSWSMVQIPITEYAIQNILRLDMLVPIAIIGVIIFLIDRDHKFHTTTTRKSKE